MTWRDWTARLHLPTLAVGVVILAAWSALSWRYGAFVLPTPLSVLSGLGDIVRSGEIWRHTGASLARIAVGFGGAVVAAVLLGLLAFLSPLARGVVADGLAVLNSTSVFVWIVISIIWFGLSNWAPIFTTLMITLPVVASNIVEGVASVDRRLLEMGDVYRLSGGRKFRAIVVPSTLPYLVAGMKVGLRPGAQGLGGGRDLRSDLRHRLHHELQSRDPGHPDGLRVGHRHDPGHDRHRQARLRHGLPAPHPLAVAVKLDVIGVGKDYLIPVIESVSFAAEAGEFVCVLGPNGCGKTTLLRIVGGIEPATRGRVTLDGQPIVADAHHVRRIGVVFQEDRLLPWLSLRDNVALVLTPLGGTAAARAATAERYLRLVGLAGFEDYYPGRVSGGMRQRAAIARALAIEPELLLMDEPFGALDAQNRRIMQAEVRRIWRETGRTIVFVTHSIEEAAAIGTTLVMLSARPSRVRELIVNDDTTDRAKLVERLNTMIMEEVERQQGAGPPER